MKKFSTKSDLTALEPSELKSIAVLSFGLKYSDLDKTDLLSFLCEKLPFTAWLPQSRLPDEWRHGMVTRSKSGIGHHHPHHPHFVRFRQPMTEVVSAQTDKDETENETEQSMMTYARRGLYNIGNTCYFNSAFQCLRQTNVFRDFFKKTSWLEHRHKDRKGFELANCVSEFVVVLDMPGSAPLVPRELIRNFISMAQSYNDDIRLGSQADADEAIHILLDTLHTQLSREVIMEINVPSSKRTLTPDQNEFIQSLKSWSDYFHKEYSIFVDGFFGQTQVRLVCGTPGCSAVSTRYEPWDLLKLEIPGSDCEGAAAPDLATCIASAFKSELLDDYTCETCHTKGTTRKDQRISRYPRNLILSLKRFTNAGHKVRATIPYNPDLIDLSGWRAWSSLQPIANTQYRVMSTIEHLGSARGGHYCMRHRSHEDSDEVWLKFDDSIVSLCGSGDADPDTYVLFLETC